MNKPVDAILACRMQGSRLYGKPFQTLMPGGITVLESLVSYIQDIPSIRHIILAISEEKENYSFVEYAEKNKMPYVLGNQKDVLGRIIKASKLKNTEYIFRATSECPFILNKFAEPLIESFFEGDVDWASYEEPPEGTGFEIIKTSALIESHKKGNDKHRSELVTSYIFEHQDNFKLLKAELPVHLRRSEVRLTVDYAEDLVFCQKVYNSLRKENDLINVEDIIRFWDKNEVLRKPLETIGIDWGHGRLWK